MADIKTKRILFPIFNRAHYGRLRGVLKAIDEHPELNLQIITSAPIAYDNFFATIKHSRPNSWRLALPWYIRARLFSLFPKINQEKIIEKDFLLKHILEDGFPIYARIPMFIDGGSTVSMAKAVGFGLVKLVDELKRLEPDIVFVNADRFEMMAVALAAAYLNIPIAHNEGGDVSGTIDESIRHSITKLAHIHFVSTKKSQQRVIQMGENPESVFVVGSPVIDTVKELDLSAGQSIFPGLDIEKPFLLVMFHPVTTDSLENNILLAKSILQVVEELAMPTIFLGSNIDARSKEVGLITKNFLAKNLSFVFFAKSLPPDDFYRVLAKASCALGNSSSFLREGAFFGTSGVLVGDRQRNRERGMNLKEVGLDKEEIKKAVIGQLNHGRYAPDLRFGDGSAGKKIAEILAKIKPQIQKKFFEL